LKISALFKWSISLITTLGQNAIPIGMFFLRGGSVESALLLYFLETILAILLGAAFVLMRAPAEDPAYAEMVSSRSQVVVNGRVSYHNQPLNRRTMIQNFLLIALAFSLIPGVFIIAFLSLVLHSEISVMGILFSMAGIFLFQLVNFIKEYIFLGELTPDSANEILTQIMSRSFLIYLSVFAGMILAAFVQSWFILPFAALKTLADLSFVFKRK